MLNKKLRTLLFIVGFAVLNVAPAGAVVFTNPALPAPSAQNLSVSPQGVYNKGGAAITGSIIQSAIGTPSAPVVTPVCSGTCATTWTYYCVALDANGKETIPSASAATTVGPATLSAANYNTVKCGGKAGALAWIILKADTSHAAYSCYSESGQACTITDDGTVSATAFTYTAQTVDQTGISSSTLLSATNLKTGVNATGCLTSGLLPGSCAEPTVTFAAPFADTSYFVACSCTGATVGAPVVQGLTKAASGVQVMLGSLASVTSQCATVSCLAYHP